MALINARNSPEIGKKIILVNTSAFPLQLFRARENERGGRRTLNDSQEKLRQLRVCEQAMNSWKRISLNIFFFGFNNGRYVVKKEHTKDDLF